MQFDSFSAFIDMGGYGFYVWLSYGTCALLLALILILSLKKDKAIRAQIQQKQKREQKLKQAAEQQRTQLENDSKEALS